MTRHWDTARKCSQESSSARRSSSSLSSLLLSVPGHCGIGGSITASSASSIRATSSDWMAHKNHNVAASSVILCYTKAQVNISKSLLQKERRSAADEHSPSTVTPVERAIKRAEHDSTRLLELVS
eukprot:6480183-Amphidinium_carterae.2